MSKRQWGHGYRIGYKDARLDAEQMQIFEEEKDAHWVPVSFYGSEGIDPESELLCPLYQPDNAGPSCQSGSGGSWCGYFMGLHKNKKYALCTNKAPSHRFEEFPLATLAKAA